MNNSPIVARWELSLRLVTRRKQLGLDVSTVTKALGFSRNYWSAIENDRTLIAEDKLRLLFDVLEFRKKEQSELLQLRTNAKIRRWWDDYPNLIDEASRHFYGLEDGARRIRAYESNLIPGLLQIPAYAKAFLDSDPAFSPVEAERRRTMRTQRQELLRGTDPPAFTALISEAALLQQVGGAEVQRQQLQYLIEVLTEDTSSPEVRVVPFDTNPGAIANSSTLLLLDFDNKHLPDVAWQEGVGPFEIIMSDSGRVPEARTLLARRTEEQHGRHRLGGTDEANPRSASPLKLRTQTRRQEPAKP